VKSEQEPTSANSPERAREEQPRGHNKISASTKYVFTGRSLTAYGGLLPVVAMLEKLEFRELVSNREKLANYTETGVVGDSATSWHGRYRSRHSTGLRSRERNSIEMF
jgi:hypothetical protein